MTKIQKINSMKMVNNIKISPDRKLFSATHEEILSGATTDIYFVKTVEILEHLGKADRIVVAEIFCRKEGILCGVEELKGLLADVDAEVWALPEGAALVPKEVVVRIKGKYSEFGHLEAAILGILASSSGWATAAHKIKKAAGNKPIASFGARHLHPAVAPVMERAALVGGADSASCVIGAKLYGAEPAGTTPHALFLIAGDTLSAAKAYDEIMPADSSRTILIDTYRDEVEEALMVARELGDRLEGVRLDTPSERGGVTIGLVKEMRARLDQAGFKHVKIFASGGLNEERIAQLSDAGVDAFGVGSFISGASAIDMTMDIKEIDGEPIAKRGRIPGITPSPRLEKIK